MEAPRACSASFFFIARYFNALKRYCFVLKNQAAEEAVQMVKYIAKRLVMMAAAMLAIIVLTFCLMHAVPGGPFTSDRRATPEVEAALNEKFGLNDPLVVQLLRYMEGLLHFDFGPSYKYRGQTVNDFIEQGFPVSGKVGLITVAFVLLAAIPMGIFAAVKNGKWQDMLIMAIATIGVTIPSFVIASLLIYIFAYQLNWLPTFWDWSAAGYILPVVALGGYSVSYMARLMRSSLLEVMGQDYIRTARAKGLSEFKVITRHALRNALLPIVTVLGPTVAGLLTGSFVVESIFGIPGLGKWFVNSVSQRDYTTIMGVTIFYAAFLMAMTLVVDVFYCLIDPRIKYED